MTDTGARQAVMRFIINQKSNVVCITDMVLTADSLLMTKRKLIGILYYLESAGIIEILQAEGNIFTLEVVM